MVPTPKPGSFSPAQAKGTSSLVAPGMSTAPGAQTQTNQGADTRPGPSQAPR